MSQPHPLTPSPLHGEGEQNHSATTDQRRAWLILALICLPIFIGSLDLTIVSAFLPEVIISLEIPLQTGLDDAAWIVSGYLLAYTVGMTFMGRVSDLVGRRAVYVACLLIFLIGSFVVAEVDPQARSGLAGLLYNQAYRLQGEPPDRGQIALLTIVIGRVIQALGAGALVPVSLALVGDLFPAEKRAQPLGLVGAIDTLGWVLGHLYGGLLVAWFGANEVGFTTLFRSWGLSIDPPDWRWLFWINIPLTLIALAATLWALRGVKVNKAQGRFDWIGTLLIVGALLCLNIGLGANIEIGTSVGSFEELSPLPPYAAPVLGLGAILFAAFIWFELRFKDPILNLRLFARRSLAAGAITNLFVGFSIFVGLVLVPILVNVRLDSLANLREGALQVGVLLSALTVPMALAAVPGGYFTERVGMRAVTMTGLVIAAAGFLWVGLTWTLAIPDALVAAQMAVVGIGLGLTFSPISAAVINNAGEGERGVASALVIILRLIGMTLCVSLVTAFALWRVNILGLEQGIGNLATDTAAYIQAYSGITVRVLGELGFASAVVCLLALIPAWQIGGEKARGALH